MRITAVALVVLVSCGGGEPAPRSPEAETPEAAQAQGYAPPAPPPLEPGVAPPSSTTEKKSLDTLPDAERALSDDQTELDQLLSQPTALTTEAGCRRVCSAIASMRRSVDAICRLGDEGRCKNARGTLDRNERRVSDSGCRC